MRARRTPTRYPGRVKRLVYLDSAYDLVRNAELGKHLNLSPISGSDKATQQLIARSNEFRPNYKQIKAPALGVFVTYDEPPKSAMSDEETRVKLLRWWFENGRQYRQDQIAIFRRDMKRNRILELHNTTHGGFVYEKAQQQKVTSEMNDFFRQFP